MRKEPSLAAVDTNLHGHIRWQMVRPVSRRIGPTNRTLQRGSPIFFQRDSGADCGDGGLTGEAETFPASIWSARIRQSRRARSSARSSSDGSHRPVG